MLVSYEREKLLNALIFFSSNVINPGKTKLFKLLNYLDFLHYQKTGRSVTGLDYYALDNGPVPLELHEEIKATPEKDFNESLTRREIDFGNGRKRIQLVARKEFEEDYFSDFELSLMHKLAKKHFKDNASDMSEGSHFETEPWHETYEIRKNRNGLIPYELVLERRGEKEDMELIEVAREYEAMKRAYT